MIQKIVLNAAQMTAAPTTSRTVPPTLLRGEIRTRSSAHFWLRREFIEGLLLECQGHPKCEGKNDGNRERRQGASLSGLKLIARADIHDEVADARREVLEEAPAQAEQDEVPSQLEAKRVNC